jgi:hypothetical protein
MIKIFCLKVCLLMVLMTSSCFSQSYKPVDSLFIVKDYLIEIKNSMPNKGSVTILEEVKKLEALIRQGTKQKIVFENQLNIILKNDSKEKESLLQKFNYILQSAILLKTDLKQNNYLYNESSLKEAQYLYKNSAVLIDKIYYHCNRFKENAAHKTY